MRVLVALRHLLEAGFAPVSQASCLAATPRFT